MVQLTNHLWQSTLFALAAMMLAFVLRRHSARVRYAIWLTASIKFLIPFAWLVTLGHDFAGRVPSAAPVIAPQMIVQVAGPFAPVATLPIPDTPVGNRTLELIPALWAVGSAIVLAVWLIRWLRIHRIRTCAKPLPIAAPIPVLETASLLEPGVFGLFRPALLLPAGIAHRLSSAQLDAILAHELAHVRRRDNLTAALHMAVESIFWFHPLVWWIGSRLIAERENACDEAVLHTGAHPQDYAEGIVSVCRFYLETPLPCASGVTGADLKRRITTIMNHTISRSLSPRTRLALSLAVVAAISIPFTAGLAQNPPDKLKFDVASIRESKAENDNSRIGPAPGGGFQTVNVPLSRVIGFAYNMFDYQFSAMPGWATTTRYDILAKTDSPEAPPDPKTLTFATLEQRIGRERERMRNLLAERFSLIVRRDSKEMPVFALTLVKGGHKLKSVPAGPPNMRTSNGYAMGKNATIQMIANSLSANLGRPVIDETGVTGAFDFEIRWTPDSTPGSRGAPSADGPSDPGTSSLFTALEEQLGLKLVSKRAPVGVLVIEKLTKPTEN